MQKRILLSPDPFFCEPPCPIEQGGPKCVNPNTYVFGEFSELLKNF